MNILLIFLLVFIIVFAIVFYYERKIKILSLKLKNNMHFYVARNKNDDIYLYLGKPIRCSYNFVNLYYVTLGGFAFKDFGLNPNDFKDLKWEDEPVEVFINMKD